MRCNMKGKLSPIALFLLISAAHAQQPVSEYAVKFVCGQQQPAAPPNWNAVAPGSYWTAVNILYKGSRPSTDIASVISTTRATPTPGFIIDGPSVTIPNRRAVEIDCSEI